MQELINIALIGLLIMVIIQDLKNRAIHFLLPVGVLTMALIRFFTLENHYSEILSTLLFLVLVLLGLLFYVSIKSQKLINPIDSFIGLGDIVFFVAILPLFYMTTYIVFFSTGMVFSILCHLLFTKNKESHVPLAGYLSLYLILIMIADYFIDKELFYTHSII